jgi:hypothetical protein
LRWLAKYFVHVGHDEKLKIVENFHKKNHKFLITKKQNCKKKKENFEFIYYPQQTRKIKLKKV